MAVFQAAFLNELEKLYKKKKALVALILSCIVIICGQVLIIGVRSGLGIRGVGSLEFPILVLSVVANTILPLFAALIAIDSFSGEFSHNIIRATLTRPVSRIKIFTAKIMAIAAFLLTNLLLLFVLSSLAGFLFNATSARVFSLVQPLIAYLVSLLPLLVLVLGIIILTMLFKSGTSVFFVSILLFLALKAAGMFFPQYGNLLLTTQLDWYSLWLSGTLPWAKILRQLLIMIGYAIILFTAGYYLFDKKDF